MPELPEVETIRQDLVKKIIGKKIIKVEVYTPKSVGGDVKYFTKALESNSITGIDRRGKLLIWHLQNPSPSGRGARGEGLLVHLKMTGQLIYIKETPTTPSLVRTRDTPPPAGGDTKVEVVAGGHKLSEQDIENLPNKFTRIAFVFADSSQLFFNDLRLFGYMKLVNKEALNKALQKFGPEPLNPHPPSLSQRERGIVHPPPLGEGQGARAFTFKYFSSLFQKRKKTTLKALLLNQELIAGLGNIYVDEVCFCAGVRPSRRVGAVTKAEQRKLFSCIPKILKEALHHRGTTFRNFLDSSGRKGNYTDFLRVYDRDGEPCKKCGAIIKKIRAAGRGTHYCAHCQK